MNIFLFKFNWCDGFKFFSFFAIISSFNKFKSCDIQRMERFSYQLMEIPFSLILPKGNFALEQQEALNKIFKLTFKALNLIMPSTFHSTITTRTWDYFQMPCFNSTPQKKKKKTKENFFRVAAMLSKLTARWGIILANFYDSTRAAVHLLLNEKNENGKKLFMSINFRIFTIIISTR